MIELRYYQIGRCCRYWCLVAYQSVGTCGYCKKKPELLQGIYDHTEIDEVLKHYGIWPRNA